MSTKVLTPWVSPKFKNILESGGITETKPLLERIQAELSAPKLSEPKVYKVAKTNDPYIQKALLCFLNTNETKKRFGHYFVDGNELYYRAVVTNNGQQELQQNLIAKKLGDIILGNSSVLGLIGRRSTWGHESLNRGETEVQRVLSTMIPMLPFNVFQEAGLDLNNIQIVERGKEEQVVRMRDTGKHDKQGNRIQKEETVHFTGASLFKIDDTYFLFDLDRRELKHKIFNAFLVKLPKAVNSIEDAYESLKPEAVKEAETKGLEVKRQGEFFFIPVDTSVAQSLEQYRNKLKQIELRAGNNRPNVAKGIQVYNNALVPDLSWGSKTPDNVRKEYRAIEDLNEKSKFYVTSKVEHTGREHAVLLLKGWYVAIANTATESFTIVGEVD